jgi:hypothetical protein
VLKRIIAYLLVHRSGKQNRNLVAFEERQPPGDSPHFNDSFYFCGRDASGTSFVFRLGFRPRQQTELWCDLVLPGLGRFHAPRPEETDSGRLGFGPLRFECSDPGRTWTIHYSGPMETQGRTAAVDLELAFEADAGMVDFGAQGDSWSLAGFMASQKWSRAWFGKLRDLSQVHYEQGGTLRGRVTVDGLKREVALPAIRDHSFGARDWKAMRRHAWLMALLEDGSHVNVSLVSYDFLPYMHSGYLIRDGVIQAVTRAPRFEDLPARNAKGASFDCSFRIGKGKPLTLHCRVDDLLEYSMNGQYGFAEGLATFSLGAVKGVGICEFGSAHDL